MTQPIHPCLWFDHDQASAAAAFYCSVFPSARILEQNPMVTTFEIGGSRFMALAGGPNFKPNEAVSFVVTCEDQAEIDRYWTALTADGGAESQCGWLKDKFGVSWQIVPAMLPALMADPERGPRVVQAFMKMKKLVIADLEKA